MDDSDKQEPGKRVMLTRYVMLLNVMYFPPKPSGEKMRKEGGRQDGSTGFDRLVYFFFFLFSLCFEGVLRLNG